MKKWSSPKRVLELSLRRAFYHRAKEVGLPPDLVPKFADYQDILSRAQALIRICGTSKMLERRIASLLKAAQES